MNLTTEFDIRKADKGLVRELDNISERKEAFYRRLYKFFDDVDYYIVRGFEESEARRYVQWWYKKR